MSGLSLSLQHFLCVRRYFKGNWVCVDPLAIVFTMDDSEKKADEHDIEEKQPDVAPEDEDPDDEPEQSEEEFMEFDEDEDDQDADDDQPDQDQPSAKKAGTNPVAVATLMCFICLVNEVAAKQDKC